MQTSFIIGFPASTPQYAHASAEGLRVSVKAGKRVLGAFFRPRPENVTFHSFCSRRRHDTSPEELANSTKLVPAPQQSILEHIMPIRRIFLSFSESPNVIVSSRAFGTFRLLAIRFVETALVKGVLAHEVDSWEI